MLVDESAYERIPDDVHDSYDEKHYGRYAGIETIYIGIEEQQVHADRLVDKILGEVTRPESDALHPAKFVEAFALCFGIIYIHSQL